MSAAVEPQVSELIATVLRMVAERVSAEDRELATRFVARWLEDVPPADMLGLEPADLYGAALAHLRFGRRRAPGTASVRVYNPELEQHGWRSTHTIVEVVNDDMPFLVDSVAMELARHGLGVHLTVHPVVRVRRDGAGTLVDVAAEGGGDAILESFMHIEVDRLSGAERMRALEADLVRILGDVRAAVRDWRAMCERLRLAVQECRPSEAVVPAADLEELRAFLGWLAEDRFVLLGAATYDLVPSEDGPQLVRVADTALGILAHQRAAARSASFAALPRAQRVAALAPEAPLTLTKANSRSTVHRAAWLDFIGLKRYADDGSVIGEHRFLGLFTSTAYSRSPSEIPLLRRKLHTVLARAGLPRGGHAAKALAHILETFPRDELFQMSPDQLYETSVEILRLQDRSRCRLFLRPDPFGRFVSCLLYVPRERYNTALRERIQRLLENALGSSESEFQAQVSEARLARILLIVRTPRGLPGDLDVARLERAVAEAAETWTEQLEQALLRECGEEEGNRLFRRYEQAFPASYREAQPARAAVADIRAVERLARGEIGPLAVRLYRRLESRDLLRVKIIRPDGPVHLSIALPILDNLGLEVLSEEPHLIRDSDGRLFALHDFGAIPKVAGDVDVEKVRGVVEQALLAAYEGRIENDGFNRLVLAAALDPREVTILRAYCKYYLQLGVPFSQSYVEAALLANPSIATRLVRLFRCRFDPTAPGDAAAAAAIEAEILADLEGVASLDEDRILRAYLGLIRASTRTNWFQIDAARGGPKDYLSIKLDPARVDGMPKPRPAFEIFVYAPWMEGVHLRGGKVARGGIRWSDRREDFRTEILGLMKAQMVKNAVIVPVGAKGGFVVKRPPPPGDRQALLEEGIRCYRTLLMGLLDLTDNHGGDGVVPPPQVVRHDDDDPYLVVAADKGTATFSDIANAVAQEYGFWLGDAFASGGSAGYDHKAMAITARGAWESVRRHFRELGMDPDAEPFTCVGIGDMSGDVFGNGMLMSDRIRLVAAFDHRHVFVDPDPDPVVSFAERRRLFALPRSSWDDYDRGKLSPGGGVWSRAAKKIALSEQARAALDLRAEVATPAELVQAILRAPVDLLWNGGIGTFFKAAAESHADAQDRTNDSVRVDAEELRCKVVAEGGNLGFTQRARVACARRGIRINTDFIDNSAGVDCSDHEVNIKILLGGVVAAGDLTLKHRDELLRSMTEEVASLVLRDNVLQNLALSMGQALGPSLLDAQIRLMHKLERRGRLDRELERLPDDSELALRRESGAGLTRPEAAVLLAHAKTSLYADLLESELPDRTYFLADLAKYFPRPLRRRFARQIGEHRLRREIVATWLANSLVNRGLEVFVSELEDVTGAGLSDIAVAYTVARDAFGLLGLSADIEGLPASVPAARQTDLLVAARQALIGGTRWFLANMPRPLVIREIVGRYRPAIRLVVDRLESILVGAPAARYADRVARLAADGLASQVARGVAALPFLTTAGDAAMVAHDMDVARVGGEIDALTSARVYSALDAALEIDALRERLLAGPTRSPWDRMALAGLEDQLGTALRRLTKALLLGGARPEDPASAAALVDTFLRERVAGLARWRDRAAELSAIGTPDLALLVVACRALGDLSVSRP